MNIALMLSHSIEEYDQVKLLSELNYNVFSIGAYSEPSKPSVDIRPALPQVADHPQLREACHAKRVEHAGQEVIETPYGARNPVDWAKADLPDEVLDWADVIICHHLEHTWLVPQWNRIKHKRVIWRTVGQSVEFNERMLAPLRDEGLQIVRYSPKEQNIPGYCGADVLIRFYKDPDEWCGWTGEVEQVINVTQNLRQRDPYTNWQFWDEVTRGLPARTLGPGSEEGEMPFDEMKAALRANRAYLYTGTQPASYTLGLIEAMMSGVPIVSIGSSWMQIFPYSPDLFEGHEIAELYSDDSSMAQLVLRDLLEDADYAQAISLIQRQRAIELFDKVKIGRQWQEFLG